MRFEFSVRSDRRIQMIPIDSLIQEAIQKSGASNGICHVFVPHTTAAVTINENADPSVVQDILTETSKIVPASGHYAHLEGNSDAHIKASLFGSSEMVPFENGRLRLGTWQSVFFCEFDGPRHRKVWVTVLPAG
jgi:secondary thiamine-phosphate synthase enzyme